MVKLTEKQWMAVHFVSAVALVFLLPQLVHAQPAPPPAAGPINVTTALDSGADAVMAIANHRFKSVVLFGVVVMEIAALAILRKVLSIWHIMVIIICNGMFALAASWMGV